VDQPGCSGKEKKSLPCWQLNPGCLVHRSVTLLTELPNYKARFFNFILLKMEGYVILMIKKSLKMHLVDLWENRQIAYIKICVCLEYCIGVRIFPEQ